MEQMQLKKNIKELFGKDMKSMPLYYDQMKPSASSSIHIRTQKSDQHQTDQFLIVPFYKHISQTLI